jgi:hypothetical protein
VVPAELCAQTFRTEVYVTASVLKSWRNRRRGKGRPPGITEPHPPTHPNYPFAQGNGSADDSLGETQGQRAEKLRQRDLNAGANAEKACQGDLRDATRSLRFARLIREASQTVGQVREGTNPRLSRISRMRLATMLAQGAHAHLEHPHSIHCSIHWSVCPDSPKRG